MYEMIVDGQSLKDLLFITSVNRTMGPVLLNRVVEVNAYIVNDILETVDVLNKIFTGDLQEFIFTDQPDRFWLGRVKDNIKVSNPESWAKITIEIEVPSGVSYAIVPKELSFNGRSSLILNNEGSDVVFPTFDISLKKDAYMVGLVGKDEIFQFGEAVEASELANVEINNNGEGKEVRRSFTSIDKRTRDLSKSSFDISKVNSNWKTAGSFIERTKGMPTPDNNKVKVGKWATHWQTGERIAEWVKGKTFTVSQTKNVKQSKSSKAYLLENQGVWIGWLLEQDIDGKDTNGFKANNNNAGDLVASFTNTSGWHGPCMKFDTNLDCNDFEVSTYFNYFINDSKQHGAFYVGVLSGDSPICGISFSTHKNNRKTIIYFDAYGKGLNGGGEVKDLATSFWGKVAIRKSGDQFKFSVFNDMSKKSYSKTYNLENREMKPTSVIIWAGKYGNKPAPFEVSSVSLKFTGLDALVKVKSEEDVTNLPDPPFKFNAGDIIRLEMATNKAYVNGIESLSPIARGSDALGLRPGENEVIIDIAPDGVGDVWVYYRERFR